MSSENDLIVEVTGTFFRRIFRSDDGMRCICLYSLKGEQQYATLVGSDLPEVEYPVTFSGKWVNHATYGRQFQVEMVSSNLPETAKDIVAFIASMKCGIGKKRANRMIEIAGIKDLWDTLAKNPSAFLGIPGVQMSHLEALQEKVMGMTEQRDLYRFFAGDLPMNGNQYKRIRALFRDSGENMVTAIMENPFMLLHAGYHFTELDKFCAKHSSFAVDDKRRLKAAALQVILDANDQSHVGLPAKLMAPHLRKMLSASGPVSMDICCRFLSEFAMDEDVVLANDLWYLKQAYNEETFITEKVAALVKKPPANICREQFDCYMADYAQEKGFTLSSDQQQAVWTALTRSFCVITGGPGTGKSTILDALLYCWGKFNEKGDWVLMAPTGKAAVRMAETTGQPSATIHSTLQLGVSESKLAPGDTHVMPVEKNLIVLDEVSMIDQSVAAALMQALDTGPDSKQHLALVGDPEQLPSVGYGNILADLIDSKVVPVCRLDTIYRQAAGNPIITNAKKMRDGAIDLDWTNRDFRRYHHGSDADNLEAAVTFFLRCVKQFGVENVAMLSPFHTKGDLCTDTLNRRIQEALNPDRGQPSIRFGKTVFRLGDRVMQLKNLPSSASNGDVGRITQVWSTASEEGPCLEVLFEGTEPFRQCYCRDDLVQLTLAYSISVHKSQGSQYDCVILVLPNETSPFLRRSIVYTAITRAKKYLAIIGPTRTISYAIQNNKHDLRYTALKQRLQEALSDDMLSAA